MNASGMIIFLKAQSLIYCYISYSWCLNVPSNTLIQESEGMT